MQLLRIVPFCYLKVETTLLPSPVRRLVVTIHDGWGTTAIILLSTRRRRPLGERFVTSLLSSKAFLGPSWVGVKAANTRLLTLFS